MFIDYDLQTGVRIAGGKVDEAHIKAAVLNVIKAAGKARSRPTVTAEFSLGSSGVRADLAILAEDFIGIEIKGEGDTLRRLPSQMTAYRRYFDHVILVVADCHMRGLSSDVVGSATVWSIDGSDKIIEHVAGQRSEVTSASLFDLLTQEERRRIFAKSRPEETFGPWNISDEMVRAHFESTFLSRYGDTSRTFWKSVSRRSVRSTDLTNLSRFAERREQVRQHMEAIELRKRQWVDSQLNFVAA